MKSIKIKFSEHVALTVIESIFYLKKKTLLMLIFEPKTKKNSFFIDRNKQRTRQKLLKMKESYVFKVHK